MADLRSKITHYSCRLLEILNLPVFPMTILGLISALRGAYMSDWKIRQGYMVLIMILSLLTIIRLMEWTSLFSGECFPNEFHVRVSLLRLVIGISGILTWTFLWDYLKAYDDRPNLLGVSRVEFRIETSMISSGIFLLSSWAIDFGHVSCRQVSTR
ncbi:hypothetical protein B0H13DRAFT_2047690 [Mycena leptocephala]|nr:hypothetical protein B0H13DRAFT_2047690 [Mycena leptocephala]